MWCQIDERGPAETLGGDEDDDENESSINQLETNDTDGSIDGGAEKLEKTQNENLITDSDTIVCASPGDRSRVPTKPKPQLRRALAGIARSPPVNLLQRSLSRVPFNDRRMQLSPLHRRPPWEAVAKMLETRQEITLSLSSAQS